MKCPECGNECKKGWVEARNAKSLTQALTMVSWIPEENKGKMIRKGIIHLSLDAEGYYCDECMKVYAAFNERYY